MNKKQIQKYIIELQLHLTNVLKSPGYNEYAVLYYEGKIDALKELLKGEVKCKLGESFGL